MSVYKVMESVQPWWGHCSLVFWYTMSAGNNYHNKIIRIRVNKALEKKEAQFAEEHKNDTDQQLLFYLHQQALLIHHTPRKREITGWRYISERFGGWDRAIIRSGLKPSAAEDPISECYLIKEETALQEKLYKDHKIQKKNRAEVRRIKQAHQKEAEAQWRREHGKPEK